MERYTISPQEQERQIAEYKINYPAFISYVVGDKERRRIAAVYAELISTQNGIGDDDYCITDNSKLYKYLEQAIPGSKVLFLGTGTGREVKAALSIGLDAYGVTLGSRNVHFGVNYLNIPKERLIESTVENLPFETQTFDFVFGNQIFEHAISPILFLLSAGRVLKYGGKLFLEWPPAKDYTFDSNPHHMQCLCLGQAHGLMLKAGFSNIIMSHEDLKEIHDSAVIWNCHSDKMLCISGTKRPTNSAYINNIWNENY